MSCKFPSLKEPEKPIRANGNILISEPPLTLSGRGRGIPHALYPPHPRKRRANPWKAEGFP